MITVNQKAKNIAIENAYNEALSQAQSAAERGQSYVTLNYWAPNYSDGWNILERVEKHGLKCIEKGFGSRCKGDGSYYFSVSCEILN